MMNLKSLKKTVEELTSDISSDIIEIRRHLHQYPELGRHEKATTAYIKRLLQPLQLKIITQESETGLWADLEVQPKEPFFMLRSDIDALPIVELNNVPYASKNQGIMHACGHDVHTAVLIGTAMVLNRLRDELKGNVRFLFQPAEELTPGGAIDMINRGALNNVHAVIGLHVDPHTPVGNISIKFNSYLASNDIFKIKIMGKGGHAATPYKTVDPILIAIQLIDVLYQQVNRNINPTSPAVLTVTRIQGGTAVNIIPDEVEIWGTLRALDDVTRNSLLNRLQETITAICKIYDAKFNLTIDRGAPPVINDTDLSNLVYDVAGEILGADKIIKLESPEMGSEDFAWYLKKVPGMMFRLGTHGRTGTDCELHTPNFDIDERAIAIGMKILCWSVIQYFASESHS